MQRIAIDLDADDDVKLSKRKCQQIAEIIAMGCMYSGMNGTLTLDLPLIQRTTKCRCTYQSHGSYGIWNWYLWKIYFCIWSYSTVGLRDPGSHQASNYIDKIVSRLFTRGLPNISSINSVGSTRFSWQFTSHSIHVYIYIFIYHNNQLNVYRYINIPVHGWYGTWLRFVENIGLRMRFANQFIWDEWSIHENLLGGWPTNTWRLPAYWDHCR